MSLMKTNIRSFRARMATGISRRPGYRKLVLEERLNSKQNSKTPKPKVHLIMIRYLQKRTPTMKPMRMKKEKEERMLPIQAPRKRRNVLMSLKAYLKPVMLMKICFSRKEVWKRKMIKWFRTPWLLVTMSITGKMMK